MKNNKTHLFVHDIYENTHTNEIKLDVTNNNSNEAKYILLNRCSLLNKISNTEKDTKLLSDFFESITYLHHTFFAEGKITQKEFIHEFESIINRFNK